MADSNPDLLLLSAEYFYYYSGVQFTYYKGNKGYGLPKHEHPYSHLTVVTAGSICIRKENIYKEFKAGDHPINLKEQEWHEIEILENGTTFLNIIGETKDEVTFTL
jgi:quercetin dioxygenase-like cupin family protein